MFKHFKIRTKLILGYFLIVLLTGAIALGAFLLFSKILASADRVTTSSFGEIESSTELAAAVLTTQINIVELMAENFRLTLTLESGETFESDEEIRRTKEELIVSRKDIQKWFAITREATTKGVERERSIIGDTSENEELEILAELKLEIDAYEANITEFYDLLSIDLIEASTFLEDVIEPQFRDDILPSIREIEMDARREIRVEATQIQNTINIARIVLVTAMVFVLVVAILLGFLLSRSISKPLSALVKVSHEISEGDFTKKAEVSRKDEIGSLAFAFNQMADKLRASHVGFQKEVGTKTGQLESAKTDLEEQQLALMNVLEDVNEAKVLKEEESKSLLESIGEGIAITNEIGVVNYTNPAFEGALGFASGELTGKVFAEVIRAFDLDEKPLTPEMISNTASLTAKGSETKRLLQSKSGMKVAFVVNATPIYVGKDFKGVIRIFHDFSEDLRIQKQKDDFFSIASHELRTPLTVISGNLAMLSDTLASEKLTDDEKQMMADSEEATDNLIKMINDFLNVSRLDQGRLKVKIAEINLCNLIKSVTNELKILAAKKNIKLSYNCDEDHGIIFADEILVKEILINLIGNAIKFTNKDGTIKLDHYVKDNISITRVTDNGIGIDKEKQKLLFRRFQQAMERTLAREAGGTGLGLYISRQFAIKMGGDLYLVSSELGKGTVFEFTLKRGKETPNATPLKT